MKEERCRDCVCLAEGENAEWVCDELGKPCKDIEKCPEDSGEGVSSEDLEEIIELSFIGLEAEEMEDILENEGFLEDVNMMLDPVCGKYKTKYDLSVNIFSDAEDLGAGHQDNGCRDDEDDETFGDFIVQAHKDGNELGKSALLELCSGRIIVIS